MTANKVSSFLTRYLFINKNSLFLLLFILAVIRIVAFILLLFLLFFDFFFLRLFILEIEQIILYILISSRNLHKIINLIINRGITILLLTFLPKFQDIEQFIILLFRFQILNNVQRLLKLFFLLAKFIFIRKLTRLNQLGLKKLPINFAYFT